MTASTPPGAPKHSTRRQGEAKRKLIGPVAIAPNPHLGNELMNGIGKTATRSKAGCMTCRIRRKKCDLERVDDSCRTCIRLRIECLGWGAKRPESLRDPGVVRDIQNRIKIHLASNNMIKGSARTTTAPAPQPSSAPPSTEGVEAGGVGGAYASQSSFLRFDDLRQESFGSGEPPRISQSGGSSRKGKSRQPKQNHHAATQAEAEDIDGSGEDDYEDIGQSYPEEPPSSFSRHPPNYPQPMYEPPQYRSRYPYQMGSPPQPGPYHAHAAHPYPPSNLRTGSFDYDGDRKMHIDDNLLEIEREREISMMRHGVPGGHMPGQPRHGYEPGPPYPGFPSQHFIYGPGVGAASAGRSHSGYGHAGYRGPSPGNGLSSSFVPPQVKSEQYAPSRLPMIDPRQPLGPPPLPGLSRSSSHQDGYLQTAEGNGAYNAPVYRSPNQYPRPTPIGAGVPNASLPRIAGEGEGEGDVDGEPLSQIQMNANPPFNPFLPTASSFGESYTFDRRFTEVDADSTAVSAVVAQPGDLSMDCSTVPPLDAGSFASLMSMMNVENLTDLPAALSSQQSITDPNQIAAIQQQLQIAVTPPPTVNSAPMYVAQYGSQQMQFTHRQMELLHLYRSILCNLQYHIAHTTDSSIADELCDLAMHSESALFGTLTLTSLYKIRLRGVNHQMPVPDEELMEVRSFKEHVAGALLEKRNKPMLVDSGDAMAGLHMVSAVLFEGGTDSQWDTYLDVAKTWVQNHPVVKTGSWNTSPTPAEAATSASSSSSSSSFPFFGGAGSLVSTGVVDKKSAFIIKTTAWFDVIGAITMRRAPFFLTTYRELFGRQGGAGMERIMGCNEKVLLAIAETAALAKWRYDMDKRNCLSYMELTRRAREVQQHLDFIGPQYNGAGFDEASVSIDDEVDDLLGLNKAKEKRAHDIRLVSNVFRATGKLYLHTVVSKCNPDVEEIKLAVQETVEAFQMLAASAVDRSLVFPIALAGCLTDDESHREYLAGRLKGLGRQGEAVGNSKSCMQLMQAVWKKRDAPNGPRDVDWIDTMKEMGWSLLLV